MTNITETKSHSNWSKGGAIAVNWKCKLWPVATPALFKLLPWNFNTHMCLLMMNNFRTLTFDLWPLVQPPFWIIWKTVKIELVLGFLSNSNTNFYTWTLDLCRQIYGVRFLLSEKMKLLWANECCTFVKIIHLPLTHSYRLTSFWNFAVL